MVRTATTIAPSPAGGEVAGEERPDDHVIVLFGASGDLAARKLLPGFFHLDQAGLLPHRYRIVGNADTTYDTENGFHDHVRDALGEFSRVEVSDGDFDAFVDKISYVPLELGPDALRDAVEKARRAIGGGRLLHYLAVPRMRSAGS